MLRSEFFINAIKAGNHRLKSWEQRALNVCSGKDSKPPKPYDILWVETNGVLSCEIYDGNTELITLDDYKFDPTRPKPVFSVMHGVDITKKDFPNLKPAKARVSYGNVLANMHMVIDPFGDKFDYFIGGFSSHDVESLIITHLVSDGDPTPPELEFSVSIDEYNEYRRGASRVESLTIIASVPSGTEKNMTRMKNWELVRAGILKRFEGKLGDKSYAAQADKMLQEAEDAWFKGDATERFFIKSKARGVVRKKAFNAYGHSDAFMEGNVGKYIERALLDGWDPDNFDTYVNDSRIGAYKRGKGTAQGGEGVKVVLGMTLNFKVRGEDCGDTVGHPITPVPSDTDSLIGMSYLKAGRPVKITRETIASLMGKEIYLRTAANCKTESFCKTCVGDNHSQVGDALGADCSTIPSMFMGIMMSATHGVELSTARYDHMTALT